MVRKRFDTTGTPYANGPYAARPARRSTGAGAYGAAYPTGYGRGAQRPHVPRTGFISGRRQPAMPLQGQMPALPPGYAYAPGQHPQLALPPGYGPVVVQAPAYLPALHGQPAAGAAAVVPASLLAAPAVPKPGEQAHRAAVWSWRHRWALTPVVAPVALAAGTASDPGSTTWAAGLAAAGLWAWARRDRPARGRMLLSRRERAIAAAWCTVAAAWTPVAAWSPLTPTASGLLLLAGVAWPSGAWWASRRVRPATTVEEGPELSETARQLIAAWPGTVGTSGPKPLHGSRIDPDTMREPAPGAWACEVELADDVHGENATGDETRRGLERMLKLPVGCVQLATVRADSGRVALTMTPARHLEAEDGVPWPGPEITEDGRIPVAATQDGATVEIRLWNQSGVEHWWINGAQGNGKTCTSYVVMLPGVMAHKQVIFYADGGAGSSLPKALRPAMARIARSEAQWCAAVEIVYSIMKARQARRVDIDDGDEWRMDRETDPIITLWLEEASTIGRALSKRYRDMVEELLEKGRKYGVQLVQVTQGAKVDLLIGGSGGRANMKTVIAHRPGSDTAARLAMTGTDDSQSINLLQLPPQEGWAGIVRNGAVIGFPARVRFARKAAVAALLDGFTPRTIEGADLAAAGPLYFTAWPETTRTTTSTPAAVVDVDQVHDAGDVDQGVERATVTVVDVRDLDGGDELDDAGDVNERAAARPALYVVPSIPTQGTHAEVAGDVEDQGADVDSRGPIAVRAANRAAVLEVLRAAGGPLPRGEIADRIEVSPKTVTRILRQDLAPAGLAEPAGGGTWRATDTVGA